MTHNKFAKLKVTQDGDERWIMLLDQDQSHLTHPPRRKTPLTLSPSNPATTLSPALGKDRRRPQVALAAAPVKGLQFSRETCMVRELKLRQLDHLIGTVIPNEALAQLDAKAGDPLYLATIPGGRFLEKIGCPLTAFEADATRIMLALAVGKLREPKYTSWFRKNTAPSASCAWRTR